MRIVTWSPEHLDDLFWDKYTKACSRPFELEIEHPTGQAISVTLELGLQTFGRSCRWSVVLKAINGKTHTEESTCRELTVIFKVTAGLHQTSWSKKRTLGINGTAFKDFNSEETLNYLKKLIKLHKVPVIFHFGKLRPRNNLDDVAWNGRPILGLGSSDTPSLYLDILRYRDREQFSDFKIVCGHREFKCHKVILAARSEVFNTMLSSEDHSESKQGEMFVTDVNPEIMEQMINFLYTDNCKAQTGQEVTELLICADKYNIPGLKNVCIVKLIDMIQNDQIDTDLMVKLFRLASLLDIPALKATSLSLISLRFKEVLDTESWPSVDDDSVLRREVMKAVAEHTTNRSRYMC